VALQISLLPGFMVEGRFGADEKDTVQIDDEKNAGGFKSADHTYVSKDYERVSLSRLMFSLHKYDAITLGTDNKDSIRFYRSYNAIQITVRGASGNRITGGSIANIGMSIEPVHPGVVGK